MEGVHNHLAEAFKQLDGAIARCGGKPPVELLELAKHLTCAQALMTDLSRAVRPLLASTPPAIARSGTSC
jgi:hypothetical protein